ncbi:MAG: SDR family oxidoreductase [Actinobacteria bacterium]|nr:SDR family oxidoreductase [Actinomycetota bacterium]
MTTQISAFERNTFDNQVIVITGAASGLGKAAVKLIQSRGATVISLDLNKEGLAGTTHSYQLDVSDQVAVFNVIAEIQSKHKRIDALINCAGYPGPTTDFVEDIAWADYEKVMAVNLYGAIWLTQAVLPIMKSQKYGRIVQVASIAGKEGNPKMAPYNTSKSGLIGFVKGIAKEVATMGITINALAPAVIKTPINENTSEEMLKYMVAKIPAGRLGEVDEVAEIISFMASKACSFTTGFTFDISGGRATY